MKATFWNCFSSGLIICPSITLDTCLTLPCYYNTIMEKSNSESRDTIFLTQHIKPLSAMLTSNMSVGYIPYGCWSKSWMLHFGFSSHLKLLRKLCRMAQNLGTLADTLEIHMKLLALAWPKPSLYGQLGSKLRMDDLSLSLICNSEFQIN